MNPLTRALKLADDPQPEPATHTAVRPPAPAVPERRQLGPIRATRDDPTPEAFSPPISVDDASGPEASDGARLAPTRATRDGSDPEIRPPTTFAAGDAAVPRAPGGARLAPIRATRDGVNVDVAVPGDDFVAPEPLAPARTTPAGTVAGALCDTAGTAPDDAGAMTATARGDFDFRSLRRGRSIGRLVGVTLSLVAVAGAAAVGGAFLWKTELARPELVGHLLPAAMTDLAPVHTANAAVGGTPEPAADAAPRAGTLPALSTAAPSGERLPAGSTAVATVAAAPAPDSPSTGLSTPGASPGPRGTPAAERAAPAPERDDAEPERDDAEPPPGSSARIAIRKRTRADHVAASLEQAWEAYLAGDGEAAGQAYRTVLGHEPRNRDARLGLAAVAARAGRRLEAAEHYATLLASHPADTAARAALIAIGEKDPARAESRLKALLRIEPEAAHLHFSLGNLYAAQSRWSEAQQSWFSAYRLDRGNADHAYNLAVSLDHLSQSRSALGLYREALVLSRSSPASFEAEVVLNRIRALESRPDAERDPDGTSPDEAASAAAARDR